MPGRSRWDHVCRAKLSEKVLDIVLYGPPLFSYNLLSAGAHGLRFAFATQAGSLARSLRTPIASSLAPVPRLL